MGAGWTVLAAGVALAQAPQASPPPAGRFTQNNAAIVSQRTLGAQGAQRIVAAAVAAATRSGWAMSIAVVDAGGNLLAFQRLDGASLGTIDVARRKAATALSFGLKTADVGKMVTAGGPAMLTLGPDMVAVTGGAPVTSGDAVVGAVGVSGGFHGEDDVIVAAALAAAR